MNDQFEARYPKEDFKKSSYLFTKKELYQCTTLDTTIQMGKMADMMLTQIVNAALQRCGIHPSPDVGVEYDLSTGSFQVFVPRELCQMCKARKVTRRSKAEGKDVLLCEACFKISTAEKKPVT